MRIATLLSALLAIAALAAPALAQERTDWSVTAAFRATGKVCTLRFAAPKGSFWLSMEHVPPKGQRPAQAFFKLGGLPPYLAAEKASIRNIRISTDGWASGGLKGDWRKGAKDNDSRFQFALPYDQLLATLAKSYTLKVELPLGDNRQEFEFDLRGSSAPVNSYAACIAG
jgi:hypothetical protein